MASISSELPATYEAARKALAQCERLDECYSWADKAVELASYGKRLDEVATHLLFAKTLPAALPNHVSHSISKKVGHSILI